MDLVVIAQIITGLATLIVALVLVFQLKKQNQQLELQHKDAEIQVSMMGENVHERLYNFANYSDEFLKILYKAKNSELNLLSDEERWKFESWARNVFRKTVIDWRLGRAENTDFSYTLAFNQFFTYKSSLDFYKNFLRHNLLRLEKEAKDGKTLFKLGLLKIADKSFEEVTGEKIGD
ncbi:MAG: hypothetical protein CL697_03045 [Chloroflexi bacterium]|jgi:hypothetical protein|nr:hypothetical protein [Chloroflexota bacterium]|tara:strand:+ start:12 stop:542 length:531 start_codon:yes stop_codon:yes gene_type:complete